MMDQFFIYSYGNKKWIATTPYGYEKYEMRIKFCKELT